MMKKRSDGRKEGKPTWRAELLECRDEEKLISKLKAGGPGSGIAIMESRRRREGRPRSIVEEGMLAVIAFEKIHAARRLGELGSVSAIPDLVDALSYENHFVRREASEALGMIGKHSIGPLVKAMVLSEEKETRGNAAHAISLAIGRCGTGKELEEMMARWEADLESVAMDRLPERIFQEVDSYIRGISELMRKKTREV